MVEHSTENAGVGSSILPLGNNLISGSGSVVEHLLAKEKVASSNLVFRSITFPSVATSIGYRYRGLKVLKYTKRYTNPH